MESIELSLVLNFNLSSLILLLLKQLIHAKEVPGAAVPDTQKTLYIYLYHCKLLLFIHYFFLHLQNI